MKHKLTLATLVALLLMLTLFSVVGMAATHEVSNAIDLTDAFSTALSGDSIKLMENINSSKELGVDGRIITVITNGFTLDIATTNVTCLTVSNGGKLVLDDMGGGAFNVNCGGLGSGGEGVYVSAGSEATVTSAYGASCGARATGIGAQLTVKGNIVGNRGWGVNASNGGSVTVEKNVSGNSNFSNTGGVQTSGENSVVKVGGNVSGNNLYSVQASNGAYVIIGGSVSNNMQFAGGVSAGTNSKIIIRGNVSAYGYNDAIGAVASDGGEITIDGKISTSRSNPMPTGSSIYLKVGTQIKTALQYVPSSSKPGYHEFTDNGTNTVWVRDPSFTPVTGVTLIKNNTTLVIGGVETLEATITPTNATNKATTWSSSNPDVASVGNDGTITAVSAGSATITVKTVDGEYTASCVIFVIPSPISVTDVTLNKTIAALTVGGTESIIATVSPTNATNKSVTWSSSNPGVASVSNDGIITAVSAGSATITVKTVDSEFTATCAVTVSPSTNPSDPADPLKSPDEQTVADAKDKINSLNITISAADAKSEEDAKQALLAELNKALAGTGIVLTEADIAINDFMAASDTKDGSFNFSANLKKGNATVIVTGIVVIPHISAESGLTVNAASSYFDNEKPKAKHRWIFAFADRNVQFSFADKAGDNIVTNWKSSKPKVVYIDPATGEVTFLKRGTNILITATFRDGTKLTQRINVVNMASQIKLQWKKGSKWVDFAKESPRILLGKKLTIRATPVVPGVKAKMFGFTWTMDDLTVATNNAKKVRTNVITGQAVGQTTVTVTLFNGVTVSGNVDVVLTKGFGDGFVEEIEESELDNVMSDDFEDDEVI